MTITLLYAGFLAFLLVALGFNVVRLRIRHKVDLGDGGVPGIIQAIRAHGNFTENVPLAVVLIALLEGVGQPAWLVHTLGAALVLFRLCHAQGLLSSPGTSIGRFVGTAGTNTLLIVSGAIAIVSAVGRL